MFAKYAIVGAMLWLGGWPHAQQTEVTLPMLDDRHASLGFDIQFF